GNCGALFDARNGGACPCCEGENGVNISYPWIWPWPTSREHVFSLAESVDRAARIEELRRLLSSGEFTTVCAIDCRELIEARVAELERP
ncbi:MAG: hypothetical protein ABIV06_10535, partial [Thermoanaerobaculia bacterium]